MDIPFTCTKCKRSCAKETWTIVQGPFKCRGNAEVMNYLIDDDAAFAGIFDPRTGGVDVAMPFVGHTTFVPMGMVRMVENARRTALPRVQCDAVVCPRCFHRLKRKRGERQVLAVRLARAGAEVQAAQQRAMVAKRAAEAFADEDRQSFDAQAAHAAKTSAQSAAGALRDAEAHMADVERDAKLARCC